MFGFYLMVILSPFAPDQAGISLANVERVSQEPRGFHHINSDIRSLFRRDAHAKTNAERARAVVAMTQIYQEIRHDPRYPNSRTLQGYKAKLWGRLQHVKEEIRQDLSRRAMGVTGALQSSGSGTPRSDLAQTGARGGRTVPDWGPALVDLIERTIAPEFWDVNGGPGTIVYYYPLRVLVVRATSEVHHQVGGGLGAIRDAGR